MMSTYLIDMLITAFPLKSGDLIALSSKLTHGSDWKMVRILIWISHGLSMKLLKDGMKKSIILDIVKPTIELIHAGVAFLGRKNNAIRKRWRYI